MNSSRKMPWGFSMAILLWHVERLAMPEKGRAVIGVKQINGENHK